MYQINHPTHHIWYSSNWNGDDDNADGDDDVNDGGIDGNFDNDDENDHIITGKF